MPTITGGCLCGSIRYTIEAAPIVTRTCWCRLCQYLGAGSGTVNVAFPRAAMLVAGEPARYESRADSGSHLIRSFCAICGTPMFSEARERPHLVFVRAGTLDDPHSVAPDVHIYTRTKQEWVSLPESTPAFEVFYDPPAVWPRASLERAAAYVTW